MKTDYTPAERRLAEAISTIQIRKHALQAEYSDLDMQENVLKRKLEQSQDARRRQALCGSAENKFKTRRG